MTSEYYIPTTLHFRDSLPTKRLLLRSLPNREKRGQGHINLPTGTQQER